MNFKTLVCLTFFAGSLCATPPAARTAASGSKEPQKEAVKPQASPPYDSGRADAYYAFTMGHLNEEEYELTGDPSAAERAIDNYKRAGVLEPDSAVIIERLAEVYAKLQRIRDAVEDAQAALKVDPDNLAAHRLLARIYVRTLGELNATTGQKQSIQKAIQQFQEILRLAPDDTQSALWLARLYRFENNHDKAESILRDVLKRAPQDEGTLEQLSQLLVDEGRAQEAIGLLSGVAGSSDSPKIFELLGNAYEQTHQSAKAEEAYRKAVEAEPDDSGYRRGLAQALVSQGKYKEALEQYKRLIQLEPEAAENYLRASQIYRHLNQLDLAESNLLKAKQYGPGNLEVTYNEALLYDAQGRFDDAVRVLADAIASVHGQPGGGAPNALAILYEQMGRVYVEEGKYSLAEQTYAEMAKLGPENAKRAEMLLVDAYREGREIDKALAEARKQVDANPEDRSWKLTYAMLLGEKESTDEAKKLLRAMLQGKDADLEVLMTLAQVEERGRRYADAEKTLAQAEPLARENSEKENLWFLLGAVYEREKKYELAEQEFKKVLDANPENAPALNYYGYMLADRGVRLEEATKLIQRALAEEPTNGAYLDSLGWAFYKQNKLAEAEEYLRKAVDRSRHDPTILGHLGEVYARLGQADRAASYWERSLAEWQHAVPADYEADRVEATEQQLRGLKRRLAQKPASDDPQPQ